MFTISRRTLLRLAGATGLAALLAACGQQAAPSASGQPATGSAKPVGSPGAVGVGDWDKVVAAAKQEGKLSVVSYPGSGYRKVMDAFEASYPGIKIDLTQSQSSATDFIPRILQERKGNVFSWDLALMPAFDMVRTGRDEGIMDPIRSIIVQPELLDDKTWIGGFEAGFPDRDKKWGYKLGLVKGQPLYVNTDVVKDGEITSVKDLLDPKWKGKIMGADLRVRGSGFWAATTMRLKMKDDSIIQRLYKDQAVVLATDNRQMNEQMVRGQFPIGLGAVDNNVLKDFRTQGLGNNVKPLDVPELAYDAAVTNLLWLINRAPHPNAAKVFTNWVMGKEGSAVYGQNIQTNSRRTDVPAALPELALQKDVEYIHVDDEAINDEIVKTQELAKKVLS